MLRRRYWYHYLCPLLVKRPNHKESYMPSKIHTDFRLFNSESCKWRQYLRRQVTGVTVALKYPCEGEKKQRMNHHTVVPAVRASPVYSERNVHDLTYSTMVEFWCQPCVTCGTSSRSHTRTFLRKIRIYRC